VSKQQPGPVVVRHKEGTFLLEGEELTEVYFHTDKIVFAVSTLLPGQKACVDQGHQGAHEICYVAQGSVVMHFPGLERCELLEKGDAVLVPEDAAHYTVNTGESMSVTVWACAPHL
jgi:oxalate decarboxylase/phosphoglucose isomerase-like protein (cupin superfamily)